MVLYKVIACFLLVQAFSAVLGENVAEDEYKYVVSVHASSNDELRCVGVLLNNKTVLTSARCVVPLPNQKLPNLRIKFNSLYYTSNSNDIQIIDVNSTSILPYPDYDNKTENVYKEHDFALFKLMKEVSGYNSTIKLPVQNAALNYTNSATMVSYIFYPPAQNTRLKKFSAYAMGNNECKEIIEKARKATLFNSQFCARNSFTTIYMIGADTGAPIIQKIGEDEVLIGIASATSNETQRLQSDSTIFTNIALYSEWIDKNANGSERVVAFGYLMMALTLITIFKNLFN